MIKSIWLLISCLNNYFFGRTIYYSFYKEKQIDLIAKIHSFYLGLGFTSILYWYYTILTNGKNTNYPIIELSLTIIFYLWFAIRNRKEKHKRIINNKRLSFSKLDLIALFLIFLISIFYFVSCLRHPDGHWDAIAMWNLKAKFLACGNESWSGIFSNCFEHAHRDYPLFLPCSIARVYSYIGIKPFVPLFFSCFFSLNCFILPYLYLKKLKNSYYAIFALCILGFSPNIFYEGIKQYADIPLAVFFLISLYELINYSENKASMPLISVIFSSFCFWVKNEGIPWFLMYNTFVLYYIYREEDNSLKKTINKIIFITAIIFSVFLSVLSVKHLASCGNDLFLDFFDRLKQLFEYKRYVIIFTYVLAFIKTHFWIIIIPISLLLGFIDKNHIKYKIFLILVFFMYLCYLFVYLITPHNLQWHLNTSFPRIATHLLPSLIFLGCLIFDFKREINNTIDI